MFFLGVDKVVYRLQANVPIRISTHPVETAIAKEPDISKAFCFTFTLEGHKFIFLTLPTSLQTWVFDIASGKWHEWASWGANNASYGRFRGNCALECYQTILIGDAFSGQLGFVDWKNYTEYGFTMPMICTSVTQHHDRKYLFVYNFELDMQAGVGLASGQGSNPQAMLSIS